MVSVPRGHEGGVSYHTAFVTVVTDGVPAQIERERAQNLLTLRLRALGPLPPIHLGEIRIGG